jgi:hypothetical protein
MVTGSPTGEGRDTAAIRRLLIGTLLAGILGTTAELLLLGHFETPFQAVPLVLLPLGAAAVLWQIVAPQSASVRALQAIAALFLAAGLVGIGLHYDGNEAFELEMYPDRSGLDLVQQALGGATPVLAPGTMALLGLVAFAYTYAHPALASDARTDL